MTALNSGQSLRMSLLQRALIINSDPLLAVRAADRMERFILFGHPSDAEPQARNELQSGNGLQSGNALQSDGAPSDRGEPTKRTTGVAKDKRRWTAEEISRLRELSAKGATLDSIAQQLGRTIVSVRIRQRQEGVVRNGPRGRRRGHRPGNRTGRGGYLPSPPRLPMDPVITFMRSRDYSVVRAEDGRYRVDNRRAFTAGELVERANDLRRQLGKPEFPRHLATQAGGEGG